MRLTALGAFVTVAVCLSLLAVGQEDTSIERQISKALAEGLEAGARSNLTRQQGSFSRPTPAEFTTEAQEALQKIIARAAGQAEKDGRLEEALTNLQSFGRALYSNAMRESRHSPKITVDTIGELLKESDTSSAGICPLYPIC